MPYILLIAMLLIAIQIIRKFVNGVDDMYENHPDYRGDDLFDEDTYE